MPKLVAVCDTLNYIDRKRCQDEHRMDQPIELKILQKLCDGCFISRTENFAIIDDLANIINNFCIPTTIKIPIFCIPSL